MKLAVGQNVDQESAQKLICGDRSAGASRRGPEQTRGLIEAIAVVRGLKLLTTYSSTILAGNDALLSVKTRKLTLRQRKVMFMFPPLVKRTREKVCSIATLLYEARCTEKCLESH